METSIAWVLKRAAISHTHLAKNGPVTDVVLDRDYQVFEPCTRRGMLHIILVAILLPLFI